MANAELEHESKGGKVDQTFLCAKPVAKYQDNGDYDNIVDEIAEFVRRFVYLRADVLYDLVSLWIVSTHLVEMFDFSGYLFAYSPEPGSGKSRLLEVLNLLVKNSSGILISPTEATLFRTADGGTQLLDEVDSWGNTETLRSVLNSGFQFGGTVVRMLEAKGDYEPKRFPVFCPRALAGIGAGILHVATRDRTFMLAMLRQTKGERRERLRVRKIKPEVDLLKEKINRWVDTHKEKIGWIYEKSEFPYIDDLRDRTIDISQPLAAILEVAYGASPLLRVARSRLLEAIALTRHEDSSVRDQHKVLRQLLEIADKDVLIGSATELSEMCANGNLSDPPSPHQISETLRQYDFKTKSCRMDGKQGKQAAYRYEVSG